MRGEGTETPRSRITTKTTMRILVVGGAGYIGSHAARHLSRAGHDVWALDNLVAGHAPAVPEGRLIRGDLVDGVAIENVLRQLNVEAVMHFASGARSGKSTGNVLNVDGGVPAAYPR